MNGGHDLIGVGAGLLLSSLIGAGGQAVSNWITRKREDNAVQRRAADMEAAGFNRVLAAGQPASAQNLPSAVSAGADKAAQAMSLMTAKANVGLLEAQKANVEAQTARTQAEADYLVNTRESRELQAKALSTLDQNRLAAEQQVSGWVDADGTAHRSTAAEWRALSNMYDARMKFLSATQQEMMNRLQRQAYNEVVAKRVKNPFLAEMLSKALAVELAKKQVDWFDVGKWVNAVGGITGSAVNVGKAYMLAGGL